MYFQYIAAYDFKLHRIYKKEKCLQISSIIVALKKFLRWKIQSSSKLKALFYC